MTEVNNFDENNELNRCLYKYWFLKSDKIEILNFDESCFLDQFFSEINKMVSFDAPDGYLRINNCIYIIEHFEYDSSFNNEHGSESKRESSRIRKEIDTEVKTINNYGESVTSIKEYDIDISTDSLVSNFKKIFNDHNIKIDKYIKSLKKINVIQDTDDVKVVFLMEEATPLGTFHIVDGHKMTSFNILNIKECVDVLKDSRVDYFFAFNTYCADKKTTFISKDRLLKIEKNAKGKDNFKILDWKPNVIHSAMLTMD